MGKKVKVGKARRDRFYHLAKETGYRSRAAFKLIQLNRKYGFLQRSNVIIDLCAAPGGWLQVVAENAPMSNHIIGIDLVPIPPIRNVRTLQEDITTESCRQALRKELHTAKADCVLNDGAPNVGKNWLHDAYLQAELTLHAMKLATEYLRKGGWFITKLFRSKDYDAIMWVFQQLFKQVHATKPQASRNESAEIFVVCQGYLSPDKIDPKFLDPKHVFQEVDTTQRASIDLIHPEKKRRRREGYAEGDYTQFHSLPVTEFFESEDYMDLLAQASEIALTPDVINHPLTTTEIKECAKDIKVLGKKEIKSLFLWRKKMKSELEKIKKEKEEKAVKSGEEEDAEEKGEESEIEEENEADMEELENLLEEKNKEELQNMKKAKKKVQKARAKQKARIDLKMTIPGDRPDVNDDVNIFDITKIKSRKDLDTVEAGDLSHMDGDDMFEDSDDDGPKVKPKKYFDRDDKKYRGIGEDESDDDENEEEEMEEEPDFGDNDEDSGDDGSEEDKEEEGPEEDAETSANPLVVDMGEKSRVRKDKQSSWFKKDSFAGLEEDPDEDVELEMMALEKKGKKAKKAEKPAKTKKPEKKKKTKTETVSKPQDGDEEKEDVDSSDESVQNFEDSDYDSGDDDGDESSGDSDDSVYKFTDLIGTNRKKKTRSAAPLTQPTSKGLVKGGIEIVPKSPAPNADPFNPELKLDEEGLAIGEAMVQSRKRRREIVDAGFHRYMFNDQNLPDWFLQDERKHMKRQRLVTKEEIEEYKLKAKAVDAQPIKKIAEAKARKKRKMLKRQEKARKKADAVTEGIDVSEKEKWQQIKQIYKKAGLLNKTKPNVTYVVTKKGAGKKVRRPAGVKGQFKVVDARMKKDLRAEKGKAGGKGGGKGRGKKGGRMKGKGSR